MRGCMITQNQSSVIGLSGYVSGQFSPLTTPLPLPLHRIFSSLAPAPLPLIRFWARSAPFSAPAPLTCSGISHHHHSSTIMFLSQNPKSSCFIPSTSFIICHYSYHHLSIPLSSISDLNWPVPQILPTIDHLQKSSLTFQLDLK